MSGTTVPKQHNKLATFLEAIKFEHTIFALPFAYIGMILAARGLPALSQFIWITLAMVGARTAAMSLNRLIDSAQDAQNPRTQNRAIPRGLIAANEMKLWAIAATVLLVVSAWQLNWLAFALSPLALIFLVGYSYTKRFTWLCHFVLGLTDGIAPIGAWVGVQAAITLPAILLGLVVTFWIGGFDILYACQDIDFDRRMRLHSIPARFGVPAALMIARIAHIITVALLAATGVLLHLGIAWWIGIVVVAALLVYEHTLVKPHDLSKINVAFFNINSYIALVIFIAGVLGLL